MSDRRLTSAAKARTSEANNRKPSTINPVLCGSLGRIEGEHSRLTGDIFKQRNFLGQFLAIAVTVSRRLVIERASSAPESPVFPFVSIFKSLAGISQQFLPLKMMCSAAALCSDTTDVMSSALE
jgi:hypothetical protein